MITDAGRFGYAYDELGRQLGRASDYDDAEQLTAIRKRAAKLAGDARQIGAWQWATPLQAIADTAQERYHALKRAQRDHRAPWARALDGDN